MIDNKDMKWSGATPLAGMKAAYNKAVDIITTNLNKVLKSTEETIPHQIEQLQQDIVDSTEAGKTFTNRAIANLSADNVGLGNVDNTADADKPLSIPQQTAVNQAILDFAAASVEELPGDPVGDEPDLSPTAKEFIVEKVHEIASMEGAIPVEQATAIKLGVVKGGGDVKIDVNGNMNVPTLKQQIDNANEAADNAKKQAAKVATNLGNMAALPEGCSSVIEAVQQSFTLGNEKKTALVEILVANEVDCSTSDTWETILSQLSELPIGNTDLSDAFVEPDQLLSGVVAYSKDGRVEGNIPDRSCTPINGGQADDMSSYLTPEITINKAEMVQWARFGSNGNLKSLLAFTAPRGYYGKGAMVYANPSDVAEAIGLTPDRLTNGAKVLGITGTGAGGSRKVLLATDRSNDKLNISFTAEELENYSCVIIEVFASEDSSNPITKLMYSVEDLSQPIETALISDSSRNVLATATVGGGLLEMSEQVARCGYAIYGIDSVSI